jgi:hypothetical protein
MNETADLAEEMGGSGVPAKETLGDVGGNTGTETPPAAWTSQLSKEIRDNAEVFGKVKDFKSISELANAYLTAGKPLSNDELLEQLGMPRPDEPYGIEDKVADLDGFLDAIRGAKLTKGQAAALADKYRELVGAATNRALETRVAGFETAVKENSVALTEEFGAEALNWWRKGVGLEKDLRATIAKAGLGGSKALMRALVLLGRETSEESTGGSNGRSGKSSARTWADGGGFGFSFAN